MVVNDDLLLSYINCLVPIDCQLNAETLNLEKFECSAVFWRDKLVKFSKVNVKRSFANLIRIPMLDVQGFWCINTSPQL
jgi:hypothetical protein